ncbi:MAG: 2-oxoacid:acceptor oxidoreductase family protein, partial [Candidatus Pacearchaeota archaeon]
MQTRSILIAGEAGQGIDKISDILAGALTKYGYYVFVYRDYQSRIKGGLNFNVISFSKNKIYSSENHYDICVFLSENISDDMVNAVKNGGVIICDKKVEELRSDILNKIKAKKGICQSIDCDDIIRKHGFNKIVANSILIGALAKVLGMEKQIFFDIFNVEFKKFLKENKQAFEIGYSIELSKRGKSKRGLKLSKTKAEIIYLKGNDAIAYAFRLAGIEAYLAYPMTPSTGLLHALAKTNGFVYQPENEIAVINAALGISACGKKVAIGSSGGGFALMIEALSFAGMAELPLVIYLVSRYGPSTGAPTYTSQADLKFAINSGHGEFAKVVLSLTDIKSAMLNAIKAFELAYSYRIPVILLADKNFAESGFSLDKEELREVESYAKQYLEREKQRQQRQQRLMKAAKNEKSESEEGLSKVYDL